MVDELSRVRITVTGDAMCDMRQIRACTILEHGTEHWDFTDNLSSLNAYFSESDYTVVNLETPIAGPEAGFSFEQYSFNAPVEFAESLKKAGVNLVTTANNHCLDRGVSGLLKTLFHVDRTGLDHIGTWRSREERVPFIRNFQGIRVGFLSYTYGTNAFLNRCYLKRNELFMVNLSQKQELTNPLSRFWFHHPDSLFSVVYGRLLRWLFPSQFSLPVYERREGRRSARKRMVQDIAACRKAGADLIVCFMHMGGQFNQKATEDTRQRTEFLLDHGVNAVIGHHEHVVHGSDFSRMDQDRVAVYSLGNLIGEAGVTGVPFDRMAEYSIVFNLYPGFRESSSVRKPGFLRCTFSIAVSVCADTVRSDDQPEGSGGTPDSLSPVRCMLLYDVLKQKEAAGDPAYRRLLHDNAVMVRTFLGLPDEQEIPLKLEYEVSPDLW